MLSALMMCPTFGRLSAITRSNGNPILALHVVSHETAVKILKNHDLSLVGQDDIVWEGVDGS